MEGDEKYAIQLPRWVWTELDRIAHETRCSRNDIFVQQVVRLTDDAEYRDRIAVNVCALLRSSDPTTPWPQDPREALAVGFLICRWERAVVDAILDLDTEELDRLDQQVKRTGRTIDQIILRNLFEGGEADAADWWKRDSAP
jgi:hypothetical protein